MNTYGLTTESRIKTRLDIDNTDLDVLIKRLIYGATDTIERYCNGRRFLRTTGIVEYFDGSHMDGRSRKMITLKNAPLVTITSVQFNSGTYQTPVWTTWSPTNYYSDDELGAIFTDCGFPAGKKNIKVTYTAGYIMDFANEYDETKHTIPYDLTEACEKMVVHFLKKRESEGKTQEALVNSTISWGEYITSDIKQILAPYKRDYFV